ncbi:MAG: hypothetical protein Q8M54_02070 [Desulfobaccales bacterium]|nr:hypothetical protein [Desulfobaccales bacterium]
MPKTRAKGGYRRQQLEDYRAYQEEMLNLSREYSRARLAIWTEEARGLREIWGDFAREWQGNMEQMSALAGEKFGEIAAQGEATAGLLSQSLNKSLSQVSGEVEDWGEHFLQTLQKVALAWGGTFGGGGASGGGWTSLLGGALDFGGWFHQGGIVEAHQGLVVSPGSLMADEQLVMAQAGEGILPRESMSRLGEKNFEALRTGRFGVAPGGGGPRYDITIQVNTLDGAGVKGLDWSRLVQRHIIPQLQKEGDRTW